MHEFMSLASMSFELQLLALTVFTFAMLKFFPECDFERLLKEVVAGVGFPIRRSGEYYSDIIHNPASSQIISSS